MYQIAYVLSSKIYFSENFGRPTHYNTVIGASELQSKSIIGACTVRQLAGEAFYR